MSAKRWHLLLFVFAAFSAQAPTRHCLAAADSDERAEASAQSRNRRLPFKTLAQRIPSVTHRAVSKAGRAELSVQLGLSLTDPFFRYISPGITARYHFDETWAVGALFDYQGAVSTPLTIVARSDTAAKADLNHPNLLVGVEGVWLPIYGKINWMAEKVSHFDMYLSVGAGFMALHHGGALAGTFAIGQHYFISPLTAFKIEIREELYGMARNPQTSSATKLESLLMASVGVSFFVPKTGAFGQP
jgi:outer membrane beta-barrel protein